MLPGKFLANRFRHLPLQQLAGMARRRPSTFARRACILLLRMEKDFISMVIKTLATYQAAALPVVRGHFRPARAP